MNADNRKHSGSEHDDDDDFRMEAEQPRVAPAFPFDTAEPAQADHARPVREAPAAVPTDDGTCPGCGHTWREGAEVCAYCGYQSTEAAQESTAAVEPEAATGAPPWIYAVALTVIVALIGVAVYYAWPTANVVGLWESVPAGGSSFSGQRGGEHAITLGEDGTVQLSDGWSGTYELSGYTLTMHLEKNGEKRTETAEISYLTEDQLEFESFPLLGGHNRFRKR